MSGLPPHIAQIIAGHRDINVTLGYKAVYPDQAIRPIWRSWPGGGHCGPARNTASLPTRNGKNSSVIRTAKGRHRHLRASVGTPCIHEHSLFALQHALASPDQRHRIAEIRDNLIARIAEAEREGWLGEIEGLKVSLAGASDKLAQIGRRSQAEPRQPRHARLPPTPPPQGALMKPAPVTDSLLHDLVCALPPRAHASSAVAAAITLETRPALRADTGDFDQEWDLPGGMPARRNPRRRPRPHPGLRLRAGHRGVRRLSRQS